jgi:hypothetical protein
MDNEEVKQPKLKGRQKHPNHGGKREGSGRRAGSKDKLTIAGILDQIEKQSKGTNYEEILVADFLDARTRKDTTLMMKYHQLILQKVLINQSRIEVVESPDVVEAKRQAFVDALARLTAISKE